MLGFFFQLRWVDLVSSVCFSLSLSLSVACLMSVLHVGLEKSSLGCVAGMDTAKTKDGATMTITITITIST